MPSSLKNSMLATRYARREKLERASSLPCEGGREKVS
jgi:hypothetical protein